MEKGRVSASMIDAAGWGVFYVERAYSLGHEF